ncbi:MULTISPECIES: ABC transporter substrate-binding protein [Amycolatopsis]|uniref:ABC transporter substrate-binding protein n=1 Tax=Amycolatopsis dendrobii TaxID=2760662 RepID=A0A7W3ZC98_9PSEU|nr:MULTISPECIES: ABC transporter substrate-binding protein [Amycolatopsis]MBB1155624.1 ABC transporter substrate-binding protein [Amycolatopsis dendrobii]UKD52836.1 ABC transporter substrate-binding protein [Amycolatopsis sp. FU40]
MQQLRLTRTCRAALIGLAGVLAVSLSACAESKRDEAGGGGSGGTMVFGNTGNPKVFDPIFADEGETLRITRQMLDTLIQNKPGTADLAPSLAEKWTSSNEGKTWTFDLKQGVKFSDGTPFDAKAVCFNFDRWYNMKGATAQSQMIYYGDVWGGFAHNEGITKGDPLYKSCEAKDDHTAVLNLTRAKGAFPAAFTLPSFAIQSPTALKKYNADKVTGSGTSITYSEYAYKHPTGTGPFKFESWDQGNGQITLVRNETSTMPAPAKLDKLVFKVIPDENARKQALKAGDINGYDFPAPADYGLLRNDGEQVLIRPSFNVLYLGINQKGNPLLKKPEVRKALAYGINREQFVRSKLAEGSEVATEFVPKAISGYTDDVTKYPYDPAKAKQLLKDAGAEGMTLKFYYPTEVTRPYMPNPADTYTAISEDLKAIGINVQPVAESWNGGYKDDVQQNGKQDIHLLGWTGDYNDAGNFVGTFFGRPKPEFGLEDTDIFNTLAAADASPAGDAHTKAYQDANKKIMDALPAIPIAYPTPAIVVGPKIKGVVASPLTDERFNNVTIG